MFIKLKIVNININGNYLFRKSCDPLLNNTKLNAFISIILLIIICKPSSIINKYFNYLVDNKDFFLINEYLKFNY